MSVSGCFDPSLRARRRSEILQALPVLVHRLFNRRVLTPLPSPRTRLAVPVSRERLIGRSLRQSCQSRFAKIVALGLASHRLAVVAAFPEQLIPVRLPGNISYRLV